MFQTYADNLFGIETVPTTTDQGINQGGVEAFGTFVVQHFTQDLNVVVDGLHVAQCTSLVEDHIGRDTSSARYLERQTLQFTLIERTVFTTDWLLLEVTGVPDSTDHGDQHLFLR
ncbi:hypothetical protein D3C85_1073240 [compost metagenome]